VIKFVSDLWQVNGFLRVPRFPPPIKLTTVALNTINLKPWIKQIITLYLYRIRHYHKNYKDEGFFVLWALFQNCVRWSWLPTKMATKLKIEKGGMKLKKNLLLWNYWANLNQTLLKWSLGGPLPKLCPTFQTSDQDGHHSRT
jgi:hypothetical protein